MGNYSSCSKKQGQRSNQIAACLQRPPSGHFGGPFDSNQKPESDAQKKCPRLVDSRALKPGGKNTKGDLFLQVDLLKPTRFCFTSKGPRQMVNFFMRNVDGPSRSKESAAQCPTTWEGEKVPCRRDRSFKVGSGLPTSKMFTGTKKHGRQHVTHNYNTSEEQSSRSKHLPNARGVHCLLSLGFCLLVAECPRPAHVLIPERQPAGNH